MELTKNEVQNICAALWFLLNKAVGPGDKVDKHTQEIWDIFQRASKNE